ncbi:MAG TPA: lipid-A-disaccharide synthase, partial [Bacteroidales bacterium]|nr:lipid-A-disaccharide synthase [Bacteroidales bacterium]
YYKKFTKGHNVKVIFNQTYDVLKNSNAAIVTSGTATLEAALFNVPQVVCYRAGNLSYLVARLIVKLDYISLVNLIMDKQVVRELIQFDMNTKIIKKELDKILFEKKHQTKMLTDYAKLREVLGGTGASERVASLIYNYLQ